MIRVLHVITGLGVGGAELMLARLVSRADRTRFASRVISLRGRGPVTEAIEKAGVRVLGIDMKKSFSVFGTLALLRRAIREYAPHVVQTWMYHADLAGGLTTRSLGATPVIWTLRQSNLGWEANRRITLLTIWTCARLSSSLPARVVCGSHAALRNHVGVGYSSERMIVVPNGFDTNEFRPDAEAGARVRHELGVGPDALLIGLFGRFDVQKDHRNFVAAARIVAERVPLAQFVLCGSGIDESNVTLMEWLEACGLRSRFTLLGLRRDMPRLNASLDIAVSSSLGEGFSNAVGEAMACAVPCVVTDVGDSAWIVGETGVVVPSRDPEALAEGIGKLAAMPSSERECLGKTARIRISSMFSIDSVVQQYERIWEDVSLDATDRREMEVV